MDFYISDEELKEIIRLLKYSTIDEIRQELKEEKELYEKYYVEIGGES